MTVDPSVRRPMRPVASRLIAAFRRPWPCDVQPVDVSGVDGLDDLPPRPFVFVSDRSVEQFQLPVQDLGRPFPVLGGGVRRRV